MKTKFINKLILSLDLDEPAQALQMAELLQNHVGCFKIGPRLALRAGSEWIRELSKRAPLFIDFKFYDIPSTTESSVRVAFELGARFVTVHASVGRETLERLAKLEVELQKQREFQILCVTVLTSFSEHSTPANWKVQSIRESVMDLVSEVQSAGLSGIVCSAHELLDLSGRGLFLVVPGIRRAGSVGDDQSRTMGPDLALNYGASALVVGRPILSAEDPVAEVEKFLQLMGRAP